MNGQLLEEKEKKCMEKFELEDNFLENWVFANPQLHQLLQKIDEEGKTEKERAAMAFHKLADFFNLPKYPEDIKDRDLIQVDDYHLYEPISMYEALGNLKFANNNEADLKSNVLLAAYLVYNKLEPFIDEELDVFLGDHELGGFGYIENDINVVMIPIKKGESWFEKGCKYFTRKE